MDRISELRDIINRADRLYFRNGTSFLTDAAYDALRRELSELSPNDPVLLRVGAPVEREGMLTKRRHAIPMGSQDKALSEADVRKWVAVNRLSPEERLHASLKMDGISASFEYSQGHLYQVVTRGTDGTEGEDITANAIRFARTPHEVSLRGKPFDGFVRAEIILPVQAWRGIEAEDDEGDSNPRNVAAGIARRKDGDNAELLEAYAFRAYDRSGREIAASQREMWSLLADMGFQVPPATSGSLDEIFAFYSTVAADRYSRPYWIDGMVISIDDIPRQLALGIASNKPRGQIAYKFEPEGAETVLRRVEWNVGHTGAVTPRAIFDPVVIQGSTIEAATLHNADAVLALDVAIGDVIFIEKRGDIIPGVAHVVRRGEHRAPVTVPTACPDCGSPLSRRTVGDGDISAHLYCENEACPSRVLGKLNRWVVSLDILGLGKDGTLASFIRQIGVSDAADLYDASFQARFADATSSGVRLGAKRAAKIVSAIEAKRDLTLDQFIGSLGVDGLGKRRVHILRGKFPGELDKLDNWCDDTLLRLMDRVERDAKKPMKSLGQFHAGIARNRSLIDRLLAAGVKVKEASPVAPAVDGAPSVCFTGKSSRPRAELAAMARAKGWEVKDGVSKGLTYLVMADPNSGSTKAVKARDLGTKCISEEEFASLAS